MRTIANVAEMQAVAERVRLAGKRLAVVPTMGYLHEGHTSLLRRARTMADEVILTIFVNPTQFGPGEDFDRYPRDLEGDMRVAEQSGADIVFVPPTVEMYPEGYATFVEVEKISSILEGRFRPTHFRGVTTVVCKLLHITKPHVALFGQKDAQQAFLVKKMVRDLNMDVDVVVAPIVREPDGLAMSSRNVYLNPDERSRATSLYRALLHAEQLIHGGERSVQIIRRAMEDILSQANPTQVDYIAFVDPETFSEMESLRPPEVLVALAVRFGTTRLIDNIVVRFS